MNSRYHHRLAELLKQTRPRLASTHELEFKSVFGAVGGYVNGAIFVSCGRFGVALRLPPKALEAAFKEEGVKQLKYFPNGHIKKEYAVLPKRILEDRKRFRALLDRSTRYVDSL